MSENKEIRTRFAPSPTGYMHIGNLRTALFTYLIAKSQPNGKFILRIEDTDQTRKVDGAVDIIYNTLKNVKLFHDEGPDVGGPYGPYVQSERKEKGIYAEYAHKLVELGGAFYCFCNKDDEEEIDDASDVSSNEKAKFAKQNDPCRKISLDEAKKRIANGEKYVIRQKIPARRTSFTDVVYGKIEVDNKTLDEGIMLKSDGFPTYNFANVIDDHLQNITHVVRGNEYLSSAPKYNILYKAFGWEPPVYIHLPPVMRDANHKLSKRNGDASFEDLVAKGYLPEAILNYIALLGWHPEGEQEIFSLDDLLKVFSIQRISPSAAIFDIEKLTWMNGVYIRALDLNSFNDLAMPYYKQVIHSDIDFLFLSKMLHERVEVLGAIPEMIDFIDALPENYDLELYTHKKMKTDKDISLKALQEAKSAFENINDSDWNDAKIHDVIMDLVAKLEWKNGQVFWPIRVALSGKQFTPGGAVEIANILGKTETLKRINLGIERLSNS